MARAPTPTVPPFHLAAHSAPAFTTDPAVASLISTYSPILCGVVVFDAAQSTAGGVLRGIGRPVSGALSGIVSYLLVGLPLAFVLGRVLRLGGGLAGIWVAVGTSVVVALAIMGTVLLTLDWRRTADEAADAAEAQRSALAASGGEPHGVDAVVLAAAVRE